MSLSTSRFVIACLSGLWWSAGMRNCLDNGGNDPRTGKVGRTRPVDRAVAIQTAGPPQRKPPALGDPFNPKAVFAGIGAFIPERVAASVVLSMTAKLCYGHLLRRAGSNKT